MFINVLVDSFAILPEKSGYDSDEGSLLGNDCPPNPLVIKSDTQEERKTYVVTKEAYPFVDHILVEENKLGY